MNANDHLRIRGMNSLDLERSWINSSSIFGWKSCFCPNLSCYNIKFQFQIIDLVNLNLILVFCNLLIRKFFFDSLADFSVNLDPNSMIFYSKD